MDPLFLNQKIVHIKDSFFEPVQGMESCSGENLYHQGEWKRNENAYKEANVINQENGNTTGYKIQREHH